MSRSKRLADPLVRADSAASTPNGAYCPVLGSEGRVIFALPILTSIGSSADPSSNSPLCAWLLTIGSSSMDSLKSQTSTATPAEPGDLPLSLVEVGLALQGARVP